MKTRTFCLTEAESNQLHAAYLHMQDANTKTRFQAVRLYGLGYSVAQILDICGGSHSRLLECTRAYREHGITALLDHRQGGNHAKLKPDQIETLRNQLLRYTPAQLLGRDACVGQAEFWSVPDLAHLVERDHGVRYQSKTSYYTLLAKCGFSNQCPAKQYKSHSDSKVMDFEEALEKKIVDTAQNAPDTVILAEDEASLYLQASVMRVFAPVGQTPVIKAAANRDNTHFYGALDLVTGKEIVMRSDLMTADVSSLFLQEVLNAYPDKPILLLWDRAPWHQGASIRSVLEANPRLEILCFPPGSPELNPQEHVWKAARTAVSHNHTHTKLPELAKAFETHLTKTRFPCPLLKQHGYDLIAARFK